MMRTRPLARFSAAALAALAWIVPAAAEQAPTWHRLPAEAVFVVHSPGLAAFGEALRTNTKIGATTLAPERIAKAKGLFTDLVRPQDPEAYDKAMAELERFGLTTEDLQSMLGREMGGAMLAADSPRGGQPGGLFWVRAGAELGQKFIDAIGTILDEDIEERRASGTVGPERVDTEVAGQTVIHVIAPVKTVPDMDPIEWPDNFDEMTPEEQNEFFQKQQEQVDQWQDTEPVVTGFHHTLIGLFDDLLVVGTLAEPASDQVAERPDEATIDRLVGLYGRFADGTLPDGGFAQKMIDTPGLMAAMPGGTTALEGILDTPQLVAMAADGGDPMAAQIVQVFGLDQFGPAAVRVTLDGTLLRSGSFAAISAPRDRLAALLDQPALDPAPPAWVPADTFAAYFKLSFELAEAYNRIKDLVIEFDPSAQQGFAMVEGMFMGTAQAPLPDVLDSFGGAHHMLSFASRMTEVQMPDYSQYTDPSQPVPTKTIKQPQPRLAFVWEPRSTEVWQTIMSVIRQQMAGMGPDATGPETEQGFEAVRMPTMPGAPEMGLFLGKGLLVLALGPDVPQDTLAVVGGEADTPMSQGQIYRRAAELMDLRPAMLSAYGDNQKAGLDVSWQAMLDNLDMMLRLELEHSLEPEQVDVILQQFRELLPTAEQMKEAFGISVAQAVVNDQGLDYRSVAEMTPAD